MVALKSQPQERKQLKLRLQVDEIVNRAATGSLVRLTDREAAVIKGAGVNMVEAPSLQVDDQPEDREPFGRWLIAQKDRGDWIDQLADAARKDPRFPRKGSPDDVRKHLALLGAEADMFEALDDAELDWLSP